MFGQSKPWAPTSRDGGATVAVIFTVVRRVRSGVGASAWAQSAYLKASNTDLGADRCGFRVALSGNRALIGAPYEDSCSTGVNVSPERDTQLCDICIQPPRGALHIILRCRPS